MKVILEFLPEIEDDPLIIPWYNVGFEDWEGSPVIYSYKVQIPLFGQECKGSSELNNEALYMLQDMTAERCTYKDGQKLLTGDYSWDDPLGSSINPMPCDCEDIIGVMGLPVSIPNMVYHKHLEWKIQKLSR